MARQPLKCPGALAAVADQTRVPQYRQMSCEKGWGGEILDEAWKEEERRIWRRLEGHLERRIPRLEEDSTAGGGSGAEDLETSVRSSSDGPTTPPNFSPRTAYGLVPEHARQRAAAELGIQLK